MAGRPSCRGKPDFMCFCFVLISRTKVSPPLFFRILITMYRQLAFQGNLKCLDSLGSEGKFFLFAD